MPVCAVTAIGPDGVSRSVERLAALAAGVMRKDAVCVTAPEQPKAVLSELVVAAAKAECELVVPDAEDITFLEAEKFTSKVDYGGYTAPMRPFWRVLPLWRTAAASASCPRSPSSSSTPAVLRSRLQPFCASSIWRKCAI